MGWFHDKYGEDAHPILPIKMYGDIYEEFGEEAAMIHFAMFKTVR